MKKWKWSLLLLFMMFALTSCRGDKGVSESIEAIKSMDGEAVYTHLSTEAQKKYSKESVIDRQKKIYSDLGVTGVSVEEPETNKEESSGDTRVVDAKVKLDTKYGPISNDAKYKFTYEKEAGEWKLDWDPGVMIPGLDEDSVIRIETKERKRGAIFDRNGDVLAQDAEGVVVGAVAGSFTEENIPKAAELLGMAEEAIKEKIDKTNYGEGQLIPLAQRQSYRKETLDQLEANNLASRKDFMRIYPLEEAAAHVIGYLGRITAEELEDEKFKGYSDTDLIGKRGLENLYDNKLHNTNGIKIYIAKRGGEEIKTLIETEGKDGEDITTTLDIKAQRAVYGQLGSDDAAGAAINPQTGDILALASAPSFNPYDFMEGIGQEEYKKISEDPKMPLLSKYQYTYSPGSTFKALTAIIGLNEGVITPQTTYTIRGMQWQKNSTWGGYNIRRVIENNNPINLSKAMADSDNIYFARVALDTGAEKFMAGLKALGMAEPVPGDYPFYTSQITNSGNFDNEILLADSGYGQGEILVSPAQMAMIYGGIVNKGNIMKPQILLNAEDEVWKENIASLQHLDDVKAALRKVVTDTYAGPIGRSFGEMAGKSGTAEFNKTSQDQKSDMRGWFVGYDQANPNIVLALTVNNVQDHGLHYTHNKFGRVFDGLYSGGKYEVSQSQPEAPAPETQNAE